MTKVRRPAVAGTFYPADPIELATVVKDQLAAAARALDAEHLRAAPRGPAAARTDDRPPAALIAPHAGYIYSGATAALAYELIRPYIGKICRVVLLGPTHRVAVRGLATSGASAFDTPLGRVPVEDLSDQEVSRLPQLVASPDAHAYEHSLEVHLPFLQTVLREFTFVPLAVGSAAPEEVSAVIDELCTDDATLLVVSSDLSHYLSYDQARAVDEGTVDQILRLEGPLSHEQACGATPVNGLLLHARRHGHRPWLLGMCNSGDTAGDPYRVVGYASVAFSRNPASARGH